MNCNCPTSGILGDIPSSTCPFDLKQIQKIIIAVQGKVIWDSAIGDGTGLDGVPQVDSQLDTLADWEALRTAVDETKVIITPFIGGDPIIEAGEAITEGGGDNSSLNGVEEVIGVNPSKFSCTFKSLTPAQEKALKAPKCEAVEVYFVTEAAKIVANKIDDVTTLHNGIKVQSYFFGDRSNEGYATKDKNTMSFSLPEGWSENIVLVSPIDFNPLYDL